MDLEKIHTQPAEASFPIFSSAGKTARYPGRWRTLLALSFGYFVDQGENQAMSVLYPAVRAALGMSYGDLGQISGWRNLLQSVSSPVWGYLADRFSRKWIVVLGTGVWGLLNFACGWAATYQQLFWLRVISGIGVACLLPPTFSMVGDMFGLEERGRANGVLASTGFAGIILGVLLLGWMLGVPWLGWRWGFYLMGGASALAGLILAVIVKEPPRGGAEPELAGRVGEAGAAVYRIRLADMVEIVRIPTLWVTFIQGIFGTAPWVVLGTYLVPWLVDQRGIRETSAPLVLAVILIGQAAAQIVGGFAGDWMHRRDPKRGRIIISQISIANGVWMTAFIFSVRLSLAPLIAAAFVTGCLIGWAGKSGRDPILQAVLRPELRSTAWALINAVEGGLSALAAFLAGWLAQIYGLQAAMLIFVPASWFLLFLCWFAYYATYPKDAARLRQVMQARRDRQVWGQ